MSPGDIVECISEFKSELFPDRNYGRKGVRYTVKAQFGTGVLLEGGGITTDTLRADRFQVVAEA